MSETIRAAFTRCTGALTAAGIPDAPRDARALVAHAAALAPDRLRMEDTRVLSPAECAHLETMLAARLQRQPVAQIIGQRLFWDRAFMVTPDVLDPRPETEHIVALALEGPAPHRLLDLGTGSGILAISLLAAFRDATGVATDISAKALDVARQNAKRHGVSAALQLAEGSWFEPVEGVFDLIVSNPPYIPEAEMQHLSAEVHQWEPHIALSPGGDGLAPYRRIAQEMPNYLAPNGRALFEFGVGQADDIEAIFRSAGWQSLKIHKDMSGKPRVLEVVFQQSL